MVWSKYKIVLTKSVRVLFVYACFNIGQKIAEEGIPSIFTAFLVDFYNT